MRSPAGKTELGGTSIRRYCVCLLVVGALSLAFWRGYSVAAIPNREFRVGYAVAPPYFLERGAGQPVGITADVIREAAARLGLRLKWVKFEGPTEQAILERHIDIWPMVAITEERKRKFHITERWLHTYYGLLSLEHRGVNEPRDTRGRLVGHANAMRTASLAPEALPGARFRVLPTRESVVDAVCREEVDAGFIETRVVEGALLNRPQACREAAFRFVVVRGADFPSGIGSTPDSSSAADAIRGEISNLARDGTLTRIYSRWNLSSSIDTSVVYELIDTEDRTARLRWLAALLAGVLTVLVLQFRKMRQARLAAERANASKSEFLANMSHELRTPLNGVVGLTAMLTESPLPPAQKDLVRDLADCSNSLLDVINDILDFSKVEAGKLVLESQPFDLHECVRSAVSTVAVRARRKGLNVDLAIDPAVPRWVSGDCARLKQVLLNLLSNAEKFTHRGGLTVGVARDGQTLIRVSVADTGIGIDPGALSRLFQPFIQADSSTTRRYGGTGLGLAISKRLTEAMHGEIGAESIVGQGSTFWFRLPLPETEPVESAAVPLAQLASAVGQAVSWRVLIAEDNAVNRRVVEHLVSRLGYEVDAVQDGAEAVAALERNSYNVVLMDCQMPVMDGYEASRLIRSREALLGLARVPVVALTAHALQSDRDKCLDAGMDDYLTKPVQPQVLAATLARWRGESTPATSTHKS